MSRQAILQFKYHADDALAAMAARGVRSSSIRKYEGIVKRHLLPTLGELPLAGIGREEVTAVLAHVRTSGCSARTARNVLVCLRSILGQAVRMNRLATNAADADRVHVPKVARLSLNRHEMHKLHAELVHMSHDAGGLLLLLLHTGLRVSELLAFESGDYDSSRQTILVRSGKTDGAVRYVAVPDIAVHAAEALDCLGRGPEISANTLLRQLAGACRRAFVPRVTLHELRHTRITLLLLAGADPKWVSRQAGHSSVAFTYEQYGHVIEAAEADQHRAWANAASL